MERHDSTRLLLSTAIVINVHVCHSNRAEKDEREIGGGTERCVPQLRTQKHQLWQKNQGLLAAGCNLCKLPRLTRKVQCSY